MNKIRYAKVYEDANEVLYSVTYWSGICRLYDRGNVPKTVRNFVVEHYGEPYWNPFCGMYISHHYDKGAVQ